MQKQPEKCERLPHERQIENPGFLVFCNAGVILAQCSNGRRKSVVAAPKPKLIERLLPQLGDMIQCDASVIVRDHAVKAIGNYAGTNPKAARFAYPYLKQQLVAWDGKQAGHALKGLAKVAAAAPKLKKELRPIASGYSSHRRGVVRKAAKTLLAALE